MNQIGEGGLRGRQNAAITISNFPTGFNVNNFPLDANSNLKVAEQYPHPLVQSFNTVLADSGAYSAGQVYHGIILFPNVFRAPGTGIKIQSIAIAYSNTGTQVSPILLFFGASPAGTYNDKVAINANYTALRQSVGTQALANFTTLPATATPYFFTNGANLTIQNTENTTNLYLVAYWPSAVTLIAGMNINLGIEVF